MRGGGTHRALTERGEISSFTRARKGSRVAVVKRKLLRVSFFSHFNAGKVLLHPWSGSALQGIFGSSTGGRKKNRRQIQTIVVRPATDRGGMRKLLRSSESAREGGGGDAEGV